MSRRTPLLPLVQKFFELDPASAAHSLEDMDEARAVDVIRSMPPTLAAKAFRYLEVGQATAMLTKLPPHVFREIVAHLEIQQGAAVLLGLSSEKRQQVVDELPERLRSKIRTLVQYPEGSAARIMSTDFLAFRGSTKVRDAVRKIRASAHRASGASYVYVLDTEGKLAGIINMRDLLVASGKTELNDIMKTDVLSVNAFIDREEIAGILANRPFFAVPVVDSQQYLLGVIRTDQLLSNAQEEASEDLQKMFGAGGDEHAFSSIPFSIGKRLPWLYVNLATAFLAAGVVDLFEDIITRMTVLAVFLPVVAGQGGNAGAQSLAVVMRGLVMREIAPGNRWKLIRKESMIGFANGVVIGVVTAAVAWVWHGNAYLGVVIGLAMIANMVAAGFAGAAIPLIMKLFGFDPSQSSSIILTTITDVLGFFSFLGLAVLFQHLLIP
jgi:magnesium transporter